MKTTLTNLALFLTFAIGIPPAFSLNNIKIQEMLNPPTDSISVRLGSARRLRSDDEAGIPKGRYNAKIIHRSGLCEDYFNTNCKGEIKRDIDFKKGDRVFFKSEWIRKPLIVKNLLDSSDSTSLTSSIEVAINKSDLTRHIYGYLRGELFNTIKYDEILIYSNDILIGKPDNDGYYIVPTNDNGKLKLSITINIELIKERLIRINSADNCSDVVCANLGTMERYNNTCCSTTITSIDIDTGDNKRAHIDIVYDDGQKNKMFLNKFNLTSLLDSLR